MQAKFGDKLYAVHETYACTFPKQYILDEQSQRYGYFLSKFHEPVVWDNFREEVTQMFAYLFYIEMLQATIAWIMKQYHD